MKRLVPRLGFSLLLLVFGFVLTEGLVRWFYPISLNPSPGPLLRGELTVPGDHPVRTSEYSVTVHVNRDGFVDQEWGPKQKLRVVVIGDSFVQAAQVQMTEGYGRVLQQLLPGVEVLSLGVPGAGTGTELGVLRERALSLHPDVVLLGVLVANDVLNNHPLLETKTDKPFYVLKDGQLLPSSASTFLQPPTFLELHSQVFAWLGRKWAERRVTEEKLRLGEGMPVDLRLYDPAPSQTWDEAWAVTAALLAEIHRTCAEAGIPLGFLLFPDGNQASPAFRARTQTRWPLSAGWDFLAPVHRISDLSRSIGPTLDLLPALQGQDDAYFPADGHWTARGHRLAAEATVGFLRPLLPDNGQKTPLEPAP